MRVFLRVSLQFVSPLTGLLVGPPHGFLRVQRDKRSVLLFPFFFKGLPHESCAQDTTLEKTREGGSIGYVLVFFNNKGYTKQFFLFE